MCLFPAAKADLAWWLDNIFQSKNPISHGSIDNEITCDASKKAGEQFAIGLPPKAAGLLVCLSSRITMLKCQYICSSFDMYVQIKK